MYHYLSLPLLDRIFELSTEYLVNLTLMKEYAGLENDDAYDLHTEGF